MIVLQALVSSHSVYLLRAEQVGGARHFAIGVPDGAPSADLQQFVGDVAGRWSLLQLSPSGYATTSTVGQAGFGPLGANAALQPVANGPAALQQVVRASDGATVLVAGSELIAVQLGAPGELDLLGHSVAP